jgi:dTDP-4-amino-4,6-dideoxygalactose transaminase
VYYARLDTRHDAVVLEKFNYLDEFNNRRRKIATEYTSRLKDVQGLAVPAINTGAHHVFHQYTVRVLNGRRDSLQKFLKGKGVDSMVYYPVPLHHMKVFEARHKTASRLEESERAVGEVLSLPIEPLQTEETTAYVTETVKAYFKET